ncbi:cytochrome c biogenesis protein CcsA [Geobacter pickeringii]|uniref:Cytochrome C biogenesis protein ResC n=1 Tax=Geobacter pickeringii TaxID=345632 RepID=A0A0B5BBV8_9BACT|nr:cytochrome c biogenesis protein CcsA [Geobacter pickeringii]AJE02499.1 cytochrome C biogenesis protein ResC [Geobacter pickeringii]
MTNDFILVTAIHWAAVVIYVVAAVANTWGVVFSKERPERISYRIAGAGLVVHGVALGIWWRAVGHGPYITRHEVLSSMAFMMVAFFLVAARSLPRIRPASILVFPAAFLFVALSIFMSPTVAKLPPTLRSIWLVLHVSFYKIALAPMLVTLAFSIFYLLKRRKSAPWLDRLPDPETMDLLAGRFAGFGFVFWGIGMLAGSIWAYQSWGRFWAWDPIETWSLITWIAFGIHLHLRRFFRFTGEKSAFFFIFCFTLSLMALFFTPLIGASIHSEYFK